VADPFIQQRLSYFHSETQPTFCNYTQKNMLVLALGEIPSRTSILRYLIATTDPHGFQCFHSRIYTFSKQLSWSLSRRNNPMLYIIADHQLLFRLSSESAPTDFCIFSQSGASSYTAILDSHSGSPNNRIEFCASSTGRAKKCKLNSLSEFLGFSTKY
jgi:hypothetical protein